jgi:hypothetical protein
VYVLSPYYKTDEKSKQLLSKIAKIRAQSVAMPVTINLLKQGIVLNDTVVSYYSRNKYTRTFFYSELEKEKLTSKFDKNYLSQLSLVESLAGSQRQLNSFYNYDKDKNRKDSLVFFKKVAASNKYQKGEIYIFKINKTKTEEEQWSALFVADSKEPVNSRIEIVSAGYYIDNTKTEQENVNELLDYFYLTYRKRANPSGGAGVQ